MPKFIIASDKTTANAYEHLAKDRVIGPLVNSYGLCTIRPHKNYYRELVESIIGQQLSVKAAAAINRKFLELFGGSFPLPDAILSKTVLELRSVGLSNAKAAYVQDVARHVINGKLEFKKFDTLSNEEVIQELTAVKGIGEWTAHMFLMFCMGRLDILPVGDLGIKTGIMRLYGLKTLPDPSVIREIAVKNSWHPYESVASWYIWQSLDNAPKA
jgi:DNA-3-methyladenine glycosylase II